MDAKDRLIQKVCPTIMVPNYGPLTDIEQGYRYLMASDGLWVESRQAWGHFRFQLWKSPRALPYGPIDEMINLTGGPVPPGLLLECMKLASVKALEKKEWAGWIVWSMDKGYFYRALPIKNESFVSVEYDYPELPEGIHRVMDLHSHPFDFNSFSGVDDHDDAGGVKLSGVISFDKDGSCRIKVRLCLEGHFLELEEISHETLYSREINRVS